MRPVEFGVTAVHWDAKLTAGRRFKVHSLLDEQRGLYELTYCFHCSAASLAATIDSGALVWTMSIRSEHRYRRCAPIFSDQGEHVFTVPHELLLELPVY